MSDGGSDFLPPIECEQPYTVTQINHGVAARVERENNMVWFVGEVSNYKRHTSGHCYLKLKDQTSQIPAVIWRSIADRLKFEPEDGMEVTGVASIKVYQRGGYYQLDIHRLQPSGLGALYAAFEALKRRLEKEGLFDPSRKRPIPESVATLGVVTARTGAAIRDIVRVVSSRAPQTDVLLCNVKVQGEGAAQEIAAAIRALNAHGKADCIIAGRGGGSVEDLWAFNEEIVARAIFESRIPIISAVGHETDFTIADFVADVRAPTPSAAAEMAVADEQENRRFLTSMAQRFGALVRRRLVDKRAAFVRVARGPALREALRTVSESRQALDESRRHHYQALGSALKGFGQKLERAATHLQALSPLAVLSRGFAVVSKDDGALVKSSAQVKPGDEVSIRFRDGKALAGIHSVQSPSHPR